MDESNGLATHQIEANDVIDQELEDDSGTGAAIALLVALLTFVLAVAFVIFRHLLFPA